MIKSAGILFYTAIYLLLLSNSCTPKVSEVLDSYIYVQKKERRADTNTDWKLIWKDDFEGNKIDTSKWTRITQGRPDWRKHMSTDDRCYAVRDGKLHLLGIVNPDTLSDPRPFLTGGVYTREKFAFQYGKVEIHAKLECAQGAWPAMWMLSETKKYGAYPRNGEIDIMEHLNFEDIIYQTTHSWYTLELGQKHNPPHHGTAEIDISGFNTFGLEWYPDRLVFLLNGKETFVYPRLEGVDPSQWPYDQPFYLLVDQQLGGAWVGEINPGHLPVSLIVDYVRVYQ
jgi:beta-glucanase (GH16 family)